MAIRFGCCSNLPPPTQTNNHSFPRKTSQLSIWKKSGEERPRNLPCTVAAIVIGAAIMSSTPSQYDVVLGEERSLEMTSHSQPPRARAAAPPKWSDTIRTCPAWRGNSLESIVPENLPRPAARRRTEAVGIAGVANGEAPPVKFSVQRDVNGGCFNM